MRTLKREMGRCVLLKEKLMSDERDVPSAPDAVPDDAPDEPPAYVREAYVRLLEETGKTPTPAALRQLTEARTEDLKRWGQWLDRAYAAPEPPTVPASPSSEGETSDDPEVPVEPVEVEHPEVVRLYWHFRDQGHAKPRRRQVEPELKKLGIGMQHKRLDMMLESLWVKEQAAPPPTDAVSAAEERVALAREELDNVLERESATKDEQKRLSDDLAELNKRPRADVKAAQAIQDKEFARWTLQQRLEHDLPKAKEQVEAKLAAAEQGLKEACDARDLDELNTLIAALPALRAGVMEGFERYKEERVLPYTAQLLAIRTVAGRMTIPFGTSGMPPEKQLAAWWLEQSVSWAPSYPTGGRGHRPQVDDLSDPVTERLLTKAEVDALRGTGMVWCRYRGNKLVNWGRYKRGSYPRDNDFLLMQRLFLGHHPVQLSLENYAIMREQCGADLEIVPQPDIWALL
jgi:hypothetical protein